jgi:outer membrane protein assembly factor BamB
VIWGDRIFLLSPDEPEKETEPNVARSLRRGGGRSHPGGDDLLLMCFAKKDGSLLWKKTLAGGNTLFGKQNMASPSPVTDGRHVWAVTGTGLVSAFDVAGQVRWTYDLQKERGAFGLQWGYASSPLLHDGKVIVEVLHGARTENPSYLIAFDGESGKVLWYHERKTDATRECPDAYTTPTVLMHEGRTEIVVSGADYVTAHDPASGAELWRAGGLNPEKRGNYRICGSPLVVNGMIYAPTRNRPILALKAGGRGDVTTSHLAWRFDDKGGPDVPTPVCDGRFFYMVDDKGLATCLDARTGAVVWGPERTAMGTVSASPLLADGKVYVTNESATTTVLDAGGSFKVLATNQLDDGYTISSMAVSDKQLFMRTAEHLYCIGTSE